MTVSIVPLTADHRAQALALEVHPEQLAFVSPVERMLAAADTEPLTDPYLILEQGRVVGFFLLNRDPQAIAYYASSPHTVGLEGFFVDRREQGRGLGAQALAALVRYLQLTHPELRELNLTVNCRNAAAIRAYQKAGFVDTGQLYHGGRSGPQHVMTLPLGAAAPERAGG
ncbi:RimJ/RimL family protein N-acetyltransferase [Deinobacterium chartae]|uniref:RimJ/RimL family protein N-acetyltransferase n=1 Tax=Deinobacterium chartae TaxID=521158 RepID=A0A841I5N9_9DEIO|nr:GNAT family N-acetyltransferase [Deinobacterium chartae]MBB6099589.1 RimJ/RimL family protein N-acetyltransferase [Deinobacterium chartae]